MKRILSSSPRVTRVRAARGLWGEQTKISLSRWRTTRRALPVSSIVCITLFLFARWWVEKRKYTGLSKGTTAEGRVIEPGPFLKISSYLYMFFIMAFQEISTAIFLYRGGWKTLPIGIYLNWHRGMEFGISAAMAFLMIVITFILLLIIAKIGGGILKAAWGGTRRGEVIWRQDVGTS